MGCRPSAEGSQSFWERRRRSSSSMLLLARQEGVSDEDEQRRSTSPGQLGPIRCVASVQNCRVKKKKTMMTTGGSTMHAMSSDFDVSLSTTETKICNNTGQFFQRAFDLRRQIFWMCSLRGSGGDNDWQGKNVFRFF